MKGLAEQACFSYLHKMISLHEEIQIEKDKAIIALEEQVAALKDQIEIYRESFVRLSAIAKIESRVD